MLTKIVALPPETVETRDFNIYAPFNGGQTRGALLGPADPPMIVNVS